MAKSGKGRASGAVKSGLAAAAKKITKTVTKAVTPKATKKSAEKTPSSSLSDLRDRLLSEKTASSPVSTSSSLSDLRDKLLSGTSATKKVDPYGLLPSNLTNPGGSSSKASSGRNLSYADQKMSVEDQDKIRTYQNNYEMATNDADRQFWHNRANQVRGKYKYTSTDGSDSVKIDTDDNEKKSSSWWPIHIPDNATTHGMAPVEYENERQKQEEEAEENATKITMYDDPTAGCGAVLDGNRVHDHIKKEDWDEMSRNADFILDNEGRLKNPEDAAVYLAYVAGLNDDTKGFLLRAYDAAEGEAKLKIFNAILSSAGWTRQTEYLYDSLSDEEKHQADHMRVAGLSETGDYDEGKKILDEYYDGLKDQKLLDYKTNQYKDDGAVAHVVGKAEEYLKRSGIAIADFIGMGADAIGNAVPGAYDFAIERIKNDPNLTDEEKKEKIKEFQGAKAKAETGWETSQLGNMLGDLSDTASGWAKKQLLDSDIEMTALDLMDVSDTTKAVGDVVGTVAQQAPSMLLGMVNPALGLTYLGLSSAGMYSRYALDSGASLDDALAFGLMAGGAEVATEKLFGGFGWFGKSIVGNLAKKSGIKFGMEALDSVSQKLLKASLTDFSKSTSGKLLKRLMAGGGEASEEMIMQLVQPYLERATFNPDAKNSTLKEVAKAGGMGFLVAEFMGIPATMMGVYGDKVNTESVLSAVKSNMKDQGYTDVEIKAFMDKAKTSIKNNTMEDYVADQGGYAALPKETKQVLGDFVASPHGRALQYFAKSGVEVTAEQAQEVLESYMKGLGGNSAAIMSSMEAAGGAGSVMSELLGLPVGKTAVQDTKGISGPLGTDAAAVTVQEQRAASDPMGEASSGQEAIDKLRDMAIGRKEGDKISVAFQQDGKTVVYDASVNAYGKLGLVFQREATPKEAATLQGKFDAHSVVGNESGPTGVPGNVLGTVNNELQTPLTLGVSDGTLKLSGNGGFSGKSVGIKQEDVSGKGLSDEGAGNIDKLLKQSTCSSDDFYRYLNRINSDYADTYVKTGKWPSDIQIPKSPDVLKADGSIDWDKVPNGGYVLDSNGEAIRTEYLPEIGEIIDRYGPNNGRFTSPIKNNKPYSYDQRSLPYLENLSQYHQYKITGDLSNIEKQFNQSTDVKLKQAISAYMKKYRLNFSDLTIYHGKIASGFGSIGGGEQYELPLPVNLLEGLGLLTKI